MKKKIAILGSTGSIGRNFIKILNKDKKNFEISLIVANKNINKLLKQIKKLDVKNIIITDHKEFLNIKKILNKTKINIYNNFESIDKIFYKKKS